MVNTESLLLALVVFTARVFDVSLGTLRSVMIIREKRLVACLIAFVEALVWVFAVSKVLSDLSEPLPAFAFALGFSIGTFVGMSIQQLLKLGEQVVRVFTTAGEIVSATLRAQGFRVTEFMGRGRDGEVSLLFVQVRRRDVKKVLGIARKNDARCYLVVDDIRFREQGK